MKMEKKHQKRNMMNWKKRKKVAKNRQIWKRQRRKKRDLKKEKAKEEIQEREDQIRNDLKDIEAEKIGKEKEHILVMKKNKNIKKEDLDQRKEILEEEMINQDKKGSTEKDQYPLPDHLLYKVKVIMR